MTCVVIVIWDMVLAMCCMESNSWGWDNDTISPGGYEATIATHANYKDLKTYPHLLAMRGIGSLVVSRGSVKAVLSSRKPHAFLLDCWRC